MAVAQKISEKNTEICIFYFVEQANPKRTTSNELMTLKKTPEFRNPDFFTEIYFDLLKQIFVLVFIKIRRNKMTI